MLKELKQKIPETYELTEKELEVAPIIKRFLLWTSDGNHILWGRLGNGYFTGKDDLGKDVWGIYGNYYGYVNKITLKQQQKTIKKYIKSTNK